LRKCDARGSFSATGGPINTAPWSRPSPGYFREGKNLRST
jgi:hypothetical protein